MLSLTICKGDCLQIGDDVKVFFLESNNPYRIKIAIEAPKEKNIKRFENDAVKTNGQFLKMPEKQRQEHKTVIVVKRRKEE